MMMENLTLLYRVMGLFLLATAVACASSSGANLEAPAWAREFIQPAEEVKCVRNSDGESFFVARAGDRFKLGARLDMSDYPLPHSFVVGWVLKDQRGTHLATGERPMSVRRTYVKDNDKLYAENIQFQLLYLRESKSAEVTINIKKCTSTQCEREPPADKRSRSYTVKVCDVML